MSGNVLPYGHHSIDEHDIAAVIGVLRGEWLTTGPAVDAFEMALARLVEAPHAVVCASGTAALHLAVLALGIGPGDVAVVPTLTFAATANCVRLAGGEVVFADVDPETGLMRPEDFSAALKRAAGLRMRAVLPVHFAGQPADMPALADIARKAGLAIVEDAAHAIGTRYADNAETAPIGACRHSDLTTFSFHPVKTVTMAEGGAVTTADGTLARRLARLRGHGIERDGSRFVGIRSDAGADLEATGPWTYEVQEVGLNYRASDLHCALGLSQLAKLAGFIARRQAIVARYDRQLAGLAPLLRPLGRVIGSEPAWHLYPVRVDFAALDCNRVDFMAALREHGVGTQVHYIPVHWQPYYRRRYGTLSLPNAEAYYRSALSLPLYPAMTDMDVDRVIDSVERVIGARSRSGT